MSPKSPVRTVTLTAEGLGVALAGLGLRDWPDMETGIGYHTPRCTSAEAIIRDFEQMLGRRPTRYRIIGNLVLLGPIGAPAARVLGLNAQRTEDELALDDAVRHDARRLRTPHFSEREER